MKDNLIYYKTTADFDNTGEVLIYKSLLELLRNHGQVVIDDSTKTPRLFLERIKIQDSERLSSISKLTFSSSLWRSALQYCFRKKRVFFVTGIGAHSVKGIKSAIKNIVATVYCTGLRLFGVKLIRLGMSMQFAGKPAELSEVLLSKSFNHYYVRDSISLKNCQKAGVKKVKLAPDLSWAYNIGVKQTKINHNKIILSFREYAGTKDKQVEYKKRLSAAIISLCELINKLLPNSSFILTHQVNADLKFMGEIKSHLSENGFQSELVEEFITLDNASNYYTDANLVISNRLHVLLLAYKFGGLPIAFTDLQNHLKIKGIFEDSQLGQLLFDFNYKTPELTQLLQNVIENRERLLSSTKETAKSNKLELERITKTIFS
ncbi:polysaccharide pyruvyl transferase family protein [Mangrovibacterium diazotrophicum]|uniref:Polysaccharide pyruvyl transferase WcaK-like protein n=1 Tax=Mangrovibacterium diazotrophicum TaxID=1261403 RepID=A0A419W9A4_9BACT|nr:polysaccharide pyruvyl transferase family protein [Mangrovibacterium diazotrophicum]RKD91982.1 polysaccharide pyruvyl transferase WcaK-like protein [Mangrovibacterium diazotrophicum]